MPRPQVIHPEEVQQAAFELVRKAGPEALTARAIAQALGCSTQPVYSACGSMAAVKLEVEARAKAFVEKALKTRGDGPPFLQLGLASLRFAKAEPHLFRLMSELMKERLSKPPPEILAAMRQDPALRATSEERLVELHAILWVFSQGLASMLSHDEGADALERAERMLRHVGAAMVAYEKKGAGR